MSNNLESNTFVNINQVSSEDTSLTDTEINTNYESDSDSMNNYDYDARHDNENYRVFEDYTLIDNAGNFSAYVVSCLKKLNKTQILMIYVRACRATNSWFENRLNNKSDVIISPDLATLLTPFQEEIKKLNGCLDFGMLNSLDRFFFGIKGAGYWRQAFGSPKMGARISHEQFSYKEQNRSIVLSHALSTMCICSSNKTNIQIMLEEKEDDMKKYVRKIVDILDETDYF
jgi:hypothetical protein